MKNDNINDGSFIIYLTIDGTTYEEVEMKVTDPNKTIREQIANIVQVFELPQMDNGGNPILYLLGQMTEDADEPEILEFEDADGREQALIDYNIQPGDHLHLVSVPIAGGACTNCPQPTSRLESAPVLEHNATGRDDDKASVFDRSKPIHKQRHTMPENSSFLLKVARRIQDMFSMRETVNSTIFAPHMVERGEVMTVQVLLYKDSQYDAVVKRAKMVDPNAKEKNNQVIGLALRKGDIISAHLSFFTPNIPEDYVVIEDNDKQVVWNSNIENISFSVFIDERFNRKLLNGKVIIKLRDIPIIEMAFNIEIVDNKGCSTALADIRATKFNKIFISYAHADADRVQYISETCRAIRCDYFFDRHSLMPGDIYPEKIFKYIDNANLFILCWSRNAAASEWVEKERKRALENLKNGYNHHLRFYPICIPPLTELPDDMKEEFNFGYIL